MNLIKVSKSMIILGVIIIAVSGVMLGIQPSELDIRNDKTINAEGVTAEITRTDNNRSFATIGLGLGNFIAIMGVITFVSFRKSK